MKKVVFTLVLSLAICAAAQAQQTFAGGLSFTEGEAGIAARYTRAWGEIRLAPELALFFPGGGTVVDINANVHYLFSLAPKFTLYPLAGFCLRNGYSDSAFGLNLGAGGEYELTGNMAGFVELKGIMGDGSSSAFTLGVAYRF
jgi:outer membrane protein X